MTEVNVQEVKAKIVKLYESLTSTLTGENEQILNIKFYKDLEIIPETPEKMGWSEDVYLVEKQIIKQKDQEQIVYELYSEENQRVATISNKGEIIFDESYIELLKQKLKSYYKKIGLEDREITIEDCLKQIDEEYLEMGKQEILENESQQELEQTSKENEQIMQEDEEQEKAQTKDDEQQYEEDGRQQENIENKITQITGMRKEDLRAYTKINPAEKLSDTENFYDILPSSKKYVQIYVVASNGSKGHNSKFYFVGITKDGEAEQIEGLEPTEGTNTSKEVIKINRDGSQVKESQVSALFRVGNYNKGFSISIGDYGIIEAQYVRRTPENEYIGVEMNTTTQKPTTKEVKEFISDTRNPYINNNVEKANKQIEEAESNSTNIRNIDDNKNNDKIMDVDEQIELENGRVTTIRKEAERMNVELDTYVAKCEQNNGQTMQEKISSTNAQIKQEREMDEEQEERTPWGDAYRRMMQKQ